MTDIAVENPTGDEKLWYKPENKGIYHSYSTLLNYKCQKCDVSWYDKRSNSHPKCFCCGRFVPKHKNRNAYGV